MQDDETKQESLPPELIRNLYEAYLSMSEASLSVRTAVESDHADDYPVFVPTFGSSEVAHVSYDARSAAIDSMTQLTVQPQGTQLPEAGIVCASPETVALVAALNNAKTEFKKAIMAIRNVQNKADAPVPRITRLINAEIVEKGYRTDALKKAMKTTGISSLDLKRCYAHIRIMPPELDVFSWTWATTHSRVKKVSFEEAIAMAKKLPKESTAKAAVEILVRRCNPSSPLVRKISLPNQLRANYAYKVDEMVVRKSCPISGVVIAQQKVMPRKLWRPNPGLSEASASRLPRESSIEAEPIVNALGLYRYAD